MSIFIAGQKDASGGFMTGMTSAIGAEQTTATPISDCALPILGIVDI